MFSERLVLLYLGTSITALSADSESYISLEDNTNLPTALTQISISLQPAELSTATCCHLKHTGDRPPAPAQAQPGQTEQELLGSADWRGVQGKWWWPSPVRAVLGSCPHKPGALARLAALCTHFQPPLGALAVLHTPQSPPFSALSPSGCYYRASH